MISAQWPVVTMEAVTRVLRGLRERCGATVFDRISLIQEEQSQRISWRTVGVVLSLICLLIFVSLNRGDMNYRFSNSETLQDQFKEDLQKVVDVVQQLDVAQKKQYKYLFEVRPEFAD